MCTNWQAFADHGRSNDITLNHKVKTKLHWRTIAKQYVVHKRGDTNIPNHMVLWCLRWKVGLNHRSLESVAGPWCPCHRDDPVNHLVIFKYFKYFQTRFQFHHSLYPWSLWIRTILLQNLQTFAAATRLPSEFLRSLQKHPHNFAHMQMCAAKLLP